MSRDCIAYFRSWWRSRKEKYGKPLVFAEGPTQSIDPQKTRHLFSAVFRTGIRTFAFASDQDRQHMLRKYPQAKICEDPAP